MLRDYQVLLLCRKRECTLATPNIFQAICLEQECVASPIKWASNQHWILVVLTNGKRLHNVENCCLQIVLSNGNQNFAGSDIDLHVALDTIMPWRLQCKNKEYSFTIAWNPCCCWIYTLLFADDFIMIYSDFIKRCNLAAFSLITALWGAESACIWEPVYSLPKTHSGLQVLWKQESESLVDILSIAQNHNLIGSLFITQTVA